MRWIFPLFVLSILLLNGQQTPAKGKRKALVIGNAVYKKLPPLSATAHDARSISENVDKKQLKAAIDSFLASLGPADTVFIYFSGYAVQSDGENFFASHCLWSR